MEWYIRISTMLEEHGWHCLKSDPRCCILIDQDLVKKDKGQEITSQSESAVVASTGGRVDDFVFLGKEGNRSGKQPGSDYKITSSLVDVGARQLRSMWCQGGTSERRRLVHVPKRIY